MDASVEVSKQTLRRFVLGKQGLWPGRRWDGIDGTRLAMHAIEYLQLDPLQIVARSHHLILHARVANYQSRFFDHVTYTEREFFDWGGWLAVRPTGELPYWRTMMHREKEQLAPPVSAAATMAMRAALHERETVTARGLAGASARVDDYRGGHENAVALYYLWRTGEAMTHHRVGFERVYARAERVAPAHLLEPAQPLDADLHVLAKSVAFAGIGRLGEGRPGPLGRWLSRPVSRKEQEGLAHELVDRGRLARVQVEGVPGNAFALADDVRLIEQVSRGRAPAEWAPIGSTTRQEVTFLAPLDPVSARGRAKQLFGFDYLWEVYLRADQVKYGRYTMPILWDDSLAGRIDLKLERKAGELVVNGIWLEAPVTGASGEFSDALGAGLARLMAFLDVRAINVELVDDRRLRTAMKRAARMAIR